MPDDFTRCSRTMPGADSMVQSAAMPAALLAGWMAVRARNSAFT